MPTLEHAARTALAAASATALALAMADTAYPTDSPHLARSGSEYGHEGHLYRRGAKEDLTPNETQKYVLHAIECAGCYLVAV
jgi:hypothetical protein